MGFFSDIMRLLEKYGLTNYMYIESFRIRGGFPTKLVWNKLVKQRIRQCETVEWQNRISDADFSIFSRLHKAKYRIAQKLLFFSHHVYLKHQKSNSMKERQVL